MSVTAGVLKTAYGAIDGAFLRLDKRLIRRTRNLRLVPDIGSRRGGKASYGEWCHVVGIFQTLLYLHLDSMESNHVLDIGCGTGLLGIASEPFVGDKGLYVGIDVSKEDIQFCQRHYPQTGFSFQHLDLLNPSYSPEQDPERKRWDIADASIDMLTALSVWTHLNEDDAIFYFREIDRVLRHGGKAIVTFFLLDEEYRGSVPGRTRAQGRYHTSSRDKWIFDTPCSKSQNWLHPQWAEQPEAAIGVTSQGIDMLIENTSLTLVATYPGNWKELPGIYFQDVLIFQKRQGATKPF